jgi:putative iron-only hydrogenase system regulator
MQTRIALIGIMVEDMSATERINALLHEYSRYVVGRMGIPYRDRGVSIISVVLDASGNDISTLAGRLGQIKGVSVKTIYSKEPEPKSHDGDA